MLPITYTEVATLLQGLLETIGPASSVTGFASLALANSSQISFCQSTSPVGVARFAKAGLVLVPMTFQGWPGESQAILRVEDPYHAMVTFLNHVHRHQASHRLSRIAASAIVHPSAVVEGEVGDFARIGPQCVVARGAKVGEGCILHASVTLYNGVELGARNVLHAGVVMGSRGFGFYQYQGKRYPVPHYGGVRTGVDCEFGPQTVVAAGFLDPTTLGDRCALDSFVQIAHNCRLGNDLTFCSQSGLAGSVVVEDGVTLAGGAQVAGHLTLGQGCTIAAKAGVTKSVPAQAVVAGFPARPIDEWRRSIVALRQFARSPQQEGGAGQDT